MRRCSADAAHGGPAGCVAHEKKQERPFSETEMKAALLVHNLASYDADIAGRFLCRRLRCGAGDRSRRDKKHVGWLPLQDVAGIQADPGACTSQQWKAVHRFMLDHNLHQWVERLNRSQGWRHRYVT